MQANKMEWKEALRELIAMVKHNDIIGPLVVFQLGAVILCIVKIATS